MAEEFVDNSAEVLSAMELAKKRAMEIIGGKAEGYAKALARVNSGILRNSITHQVDTDGKKATVTIGSNVHYAP